MRAITPTVFLGLKLKELIKFIKEVPDFRETFTKAVDKQLRLKASVNDNGEKHIDLVSGHEEDNIIPETYIVGDAVQARRALDATKEAYDVALKI